MVPPRRFGFALSLLLLLSPTVWAQEDSFNVTTEGAVDCAPQMQQCFDRSEKIRESGCTPIEYWNGDSSGCSCDLLVICSDPQTGETLWEGTAEQFAARQPPPDPKPDSGGGDLLQGGVSVTVIPDPGDSGSENLDSGCVDPPAPPDLQREALALARQLDAVATEWQDDAIVATGRFFFHMSRAVAAQLRFLAQTPGEPGSQIWQAIVTYVNNDALENHNRLLDGAVAAVRAFDRDPAAAMGAAAGNAAFDASSGAALKFCKVAKKAATKAAARIAEAKKAADRLKKAAEAKRQFEAAEFGALSPDDIPRTTKQQPGTPPVNPFLGKGHCFSCALAKDKGLATGQPYIVLGKPPEGIFLKGPKIVSVLARRFGGRHPLTGPALGEGRQFLQDLGLPARMSLEEITREIESSAGSRGLVFLKNEGNPGHVINVWYENGRARFYDAQSDIEASLMVEQAQSVWLYRTN